MRAIDFLLLCCDEEQYVSIQSDDDCEELLATWVSDLKENYPQSTNKNNRNILESEMRGWVIDGSSFIIFI